MKHPTIAVASAPIIALAMGVLAPACLSRPLDTIDPRTTASFTNELDNSKISKIDILLAIDDSGSMADKQLILADAVPQLIDALVNPACIPDEESDATPMKLASPTEPCPSGFYREFDPVLDIHIGIVSSSVGFGDIGIQTGTETPRACADRRAHLLSEVPDGAEPVSAYDGFNFLAWDPDQMLTPAGEADPEALNDALTRLVSGVGQQGCGYEASLESWYRFLIDPDPSMKMELSEGRAVAVGIDAELLKQREAFLRPDSLVAIVMLTDENDCSVRPGYGYLTGRVGQSGHAGMSLLRPRAVCAADPDDPCCAPCSREVPDSCAPDATCDDTSALEQHELNALHCFDQKRRFGMDLLQPVERYIEGLTTTQVADRSGNVVDNPLFVRDGKVRGRDRVFLAGIVGVPHQFVSRDGDLNRGLMSASELRAAGTWDTLLGNADGAGQDAHMIESPRPREPLSRDKAAWDPLHGHEHAHGLLDGGDLQYSCIFDLPESSWRDCSAAQACDCRTNTTNALCLGENGTYDQTQRRAKAYPSLRQLEVLRGVGDQGIVGSICAKQVEDKSRKDYGYQASVEALIDRLKDKLKQPCLPRSLTPDPQEGLVSCVVLEGRQTAAGSCSCDAPGHSPVTHRATEEQARTDEFGQLSELNCFCEIEQLRGAAQKACRWDERPNEDVTLEDGSPVDGWCYIDASSFPKVGNEKLVLQCEPTQQRIIRTVGAADPVADSKLFITCVAE